MKQKQHPIFWKIMSVTMTLFVCLTGTLSPALFQPTLIHAQDTGNELSCKNGANDYATFAASLIDFEGFYEDWKDILVRYNSNVCLYNDIDSLVHQLDALRFQIRNAFYSCSSNITALKDNYYILLAKIYFLRNFVKVENDRIIFLNEATVRAKMQNYLVINKGIYSKEQVDKMYEDLKTNYQSKQNYYTSCTGDGWSAIVSKWNELKDTISMSGKSLKQDLTARWDRAWNAPLNETGNLLWGFLDAKLNDLPPGETWDQVKEELNKDMPAGYTFDTEIQAHTLADAKQAQVKEEFDYLTQYQFLYQENSAASIKQMVEKLKRLRTTFQETYPWITKSFKCVKTLVDKAC